jgi:hypothetical protein
MLAWPLWATAVLLPLCLFGLCAWRGSASLRVGSTVAAYVALFILFGMPYDEYWGALYTPLMMFGLPIVPAGLRDLISVIRRGSADRSAAEALF